MLRMDARNIEIQTINPAQTVHPNLPPPPPPFRHLRHLLVALLISRNVEFRTQGRRGGRAGGTRWLPSRVVVASMKVNSVSKLNQVVHTCPYACPPALARDTHHLLTFIHHHHHMIAPSDLPLSEHLETSINSEDDSRVSITGTPPAPGSPLQPFLCDA